MDETKRAQTQKGFFESGTTASPIAALEELRRAAQRAMRELQPAGREASGRIKDSKEPRPEVRLLGECTHRRPLTDDEITVFIHDRGHGFDRGDVPELPEPDHPDRLLHESGLGLHLMAMLTDETEVSSDDDGTDVKLVVYSSNRRRLG